MKIQEYTIFQDSTSHIKREASMPLELISQFIYQMNHQGIRYCHWKSNYSLAQSVLGEIDLDLLVDQGSLPETLCVLENLGFKLALTHYSPNTPGVFNYYGNDPQTGQLIHVHLFTRVLTGESFVKSHWLPIEGMLLEGGNEINQIKVPSKSAELVLFILRIFIKYGSFLDLMYLVGKSGSVRDELLWLLEPCEVSESLSLLDKYLPTISKDLFLKGIETLVQNTSLGERIRLAWRFRRQLRIYEKNSWFRRFVLNMQTAWSLGYLRLRRRKNRKVLAAGGLVIAFVGPEATGKSTLVTETTNWLGKGFIVRAVHAGKPPSSWLTLPINLLIPWVRRLLPGLRTNRIEGHLVQSGGSHNKKNIKGFSGMIYALRAVGLARDRRRLLINSRKLAANNQIVICDRYPSEVIGAMDSPRLETNLMGKGVLGWVYNWLARIENRLYQEIPAPDIVLRLKVSMEVAKQRNRDRIKVGKETDEYLEARHMQSRDWSMSQTKRIYDIDTEKSLQTTILTVKQRIWESL